MEYELIDAKMTNQKTSDVERGLSDRLLILSTLIMSIFTIIPLAFLHKKIKNTRKSPSISNAYGVVIILLFMVYYLFEGGLLSIGNIASIYFWIELSMRDKPLSLQREGRKTKKKRYKLVLRKS